MNRKILTFILTSIWLLFWASPSIALVTEYQKAVDAYKLVTEHQKAVDAYKREDYKTAHKLILPLAEKGFANFLRPSQDRKYNADIQLLSHSGPPTRCIGL